MRPPLARPLSSEEKTQLRIAFASGVSIRELARKTGRNENTLLGIANREGWTRQIESAKALIAPSPSPDTPAPVQADVADIVVQSHEDALKTNSVKIKKALSNGLVKGAEHVEKLDGSGVLDSAQQISQLSRAAAQIHGWDEKRDGNLGQITVVVQLGDAICQPLESPIEGHVIESE